MNTLINTLKQQFYVVLMFGFARKCCTWKRSPGRSRGTLVYKGKKWNEARSHSDRHVLLRQYTLRRALVDEHHL